MLTLLTALMLQVSRVTCLLFDFVFFPIKVLSSALCSPEGHIRKLQL